MRKLLLVLLCSLVLFVSSCSGRSTQNPAATDSSLNGSGNAVNAGDTASQVKNLIEKGNEHYLNDRDTDAAAAYEEAVKVDPQSANAHYRLGLAYQVLGKRDESLQMFEKAADLYETQLKGGSEDAEAHYTLGLAYEKLDKLESASKTLKQAVKLDQENAEYYYELGTVQNRLAQYKEASSSLKKAVELDPENFRAQEALELAQNGVQRHQAALKQLEIEAKKGQKVEKIRLPNSDLPPIIKQK